MTVGDVMSTRLLTVDASLPLTEAAREMHGHSVGAVLVLTGGHVSGILTERDVLRAVATGRVEGTHVAAAHAASMMIHGGFRHLPVVQGEEPVGIVSIRDLMRVVIDDETVRGA